MCGCCCSYGCCRQTFRLLERSSILSGDAGMQGERGPPGAQGPKGIQGDSGEVGVTYIRWGRKNCPNSGATLVYEGNIKVLHPLFRIVFSGEQAMGEGGGGE